MSKVILNSGGMDSFLLAQQPDWRDALHVFVDIDQPYREKELRAAQIVANGCGRPLRYVSGAKIAEFEHSSGIIPYRNAEMILCAAQFGDEIGLGVIADEVNSDKSPEFFRAMEQVLDISHKDQYWTDGKTHTIHTPLIARSKAEWIIDYLARGGSIGTLLRTVSCYDGGEQHCGKCASCFKRWIALTIATENPYIEHFIEKPWKAYDLDYLRSRMPTYSERRQHETRTAFLAMNIIL